MNNNNIIIIIIIKPLKFSTLKCIKRDNNIENADIGIKAINITKKKNYHSKNKVRNSIITYLRQLLSSHTHIDH